MTAMAVPRRIFAKAVHAMARTRWFVLRSMHAISQARVIRRRANATIRMLRMVRCAATAMGVRRAIRAPRVPVRAMPTRVSQQPVKRLRRATAMVAARSSTRRTERSARMTAIPARRMFVTVLAHVPIRRCLMERTAAVVRSVRVVRVVRNASLRVSFTRRGRSIRQMLASNACR